MHYIELVKKPECNYYEKCYDFALQFIRVVKKNFTSEDLIQAYNEQNETEVPAEPRVWGAVMAKLLKQKKIEHAGYTRYKNPAGHRKISNVWKAI